MSEIRKNAIVTGASRGVGKAILKELASAGYNVWACANNENMEFNSYCEELSKKNDVWVEPTYFDLSEYDRIKEAFSVMMGKERQVDVLINNAGIGHMNILQLTRPAEIEELYKVNVLAPIYLSQLVLRMMQRQKSGKIINVASTAAYEVYEGNSIYGSTKAALVAFTKSFAAEAYRYGVTVNAIAPGLIDTEMAAIFEGNNPEEPIKHTALGRKIATDEIAQIVLELLSDKLILINGEVISITGGHK